MPPDFSAERGDIARDFLSLFPPIRMASMSLRNIPMVLYINRSTLTANGLIVAGERMSSMVVFT
jgi:hypothetical protein